MPVARPGAPLSRGSFMSGRSSSSTSSSGPATPLEPVSAGSLQSLVQLADDPPLHRPFPTKPRPSVLLWIVRVPDSRDVILTTLAPPRHSPSARATDIASSLYYLHFHTSDAGISPATLIRRNPSTDEQANVAHILPTGEIVKLELPAWGYQKFLDLPGPLPPRPQDDGTDAVFQEWQAWQKDRQKSAQLPPERSDSAYSQQQISSIFTREMHIEGANLWERMKGFRHHRKSSSVLDVPEASRERNKKTRDFVFDPPWAIGRCEFKDEGGGKFLKCKYYTPGEEKSVLLSVIEFKLPSLVHRRTRSEGGEKSENSGKVKAKMGMLVVHAAGQEMLDLLVAANMVAFLRRWEARGKERVGAIER